MTERKRLSDIIDTLRSWGIAWSAPAKQGSHQEGREIEVVLPQPSGDMVVGVLSQDGDDYVFRYTDAFARSTLPAIQSFPDRHKEYRDHNLWPFFQVRLPQTGRADVDAVIKDMNIDPSDTIELLGKLGKRVVSGPFELRLREGTAPA